MLDVLQKDRFTVIINNLQESVISTDRHGIVQLYNAATLNLLDTNVPIREKHIGNVLHLKDASGKPYSLLKELEKAIGTVIRDDLRMRFGMPEEIRVELTFTPIRSSYTKTEKTDSHDGYIIMLRDVTKAKSLEEERDEFISVVSHELRTPITVIEAEISNLQALMQHPDVSKEMKEDALAGAHSQVMYLAKMVNDLSALSRAERGVGDAIEEINLKDMVHSLYDEFSESAHEKGLKLNLDLSPKLSPLNSSRLYLEELLQNFINNSIKYTKAGSVTISAKQTGNEISFAVKDTGIGISKSDQEKVFNKFFRSEDYRTRETSGTGLGLYVSAKLAKKLGTKIVLVSRLNHGSVFSFSLPIGSKNVD
jgi:signal transduction histidine kinase